MPLTFYILTYSCLSKSKIQVLRWIKEIQIQIRFAHKDKCVCEAIICASIKESVCMFFKTETYFRVQIFGGKETICSN